MGRFDLSRFEFWVGRLGSIGVGFDLGDSTATIVGWRQWMVLVVQGLMVVGNYGGCKTSSDTM